MGFITKVAEQLVGDLLFQRQVLIQRMKEINEGLGSVSNEEASHLVEYKEDLKRIALEMGNLLDKIGLDETIDPKVRENVKLISTLIRLWTGRMKSSVSDLLQGMGWRSGF